MAGRLKAFRAECDFVLKLESERSQSQDFSSILCDAILINAGVTHPHPAWLDALSEGGVLVLPLSVGRKLSVNDAMVVAITRRHDRFAAELLSIITIYSISSMRDPMLQSMLNESFESHAMLRASSLSAWTIMTESIIALCMHLDSA
jgi:hypothetical protein